MAKSAPGGVAQRERRRGPLARISSTCNPCGSDLREVVMGLSVTHMGWTLLRLAPATMDGPCSMSRNSRGGDDGAAEMSQNIDDACAENRVGVPGQAQR